MEEGKNERPLKYSQAAVCLLKLANSTIFAENQTHASDFSKFALEKMYRRMSI